MPNVMTVLRADISRISRKEAKALVNPVRKSAAGSRTAVADLKRRVALLEKEHQQLQARLAKLEAAQPAAPSPEPAAKGWISGKGIKSLRKRLGLSQPEFAKLVGVSANGVYQWESKPGMLKLRGKTKAAVFAVRGIGAKDAKKRLEEMKAAAPKAKKAAARRRKSGRRK